MAVSAVGGSGIEMALVTVAVDLAAKASVGAAAAFAAAGASFAVAVVAKYFVIIRIWSSHDLI